MSDIYLAHSIHQLLKDGKSVIVHAYKGEHKVNSVRFEYTPTRIFVSTDSGEFEFDNYQALVLDVA